MPAPPLTDVPADTIDVRSGNISPALRTWLSQLRRYLTTYLSAYLPATFVAKAGDTMTGTLKMDGSGANTIPALATTLTVNEVHAETTAASDYGLLRLSAGGGTTLNTKSAIDLQGYGTSDNTQIRLYTGGAEKLRIDGGGNISWSSAGIVSGSTNTLIAPNIANIGSTYGAFFVSSNAVYAGGAWKAVTTYTGAGLYQCNSDHTFYVYSGALTAGNAIPAWTVGMTVQSDGNVMSQYYHKLGSSAPAIAVKKLTGTTGSTQNGSATDDASVAHGLTASKIISVTGRVNVGSDYFAPGRKGNTNYGIKWDGTNVVVTNISGDASQITSSAFVLFIVYEA